jgi:hypothetical protein
MAQKLNEKVLCPATRSTRCEATMAEMSPKAALRDLRAAQAGMRKARQLLSQAREDPRMSARVFAVGWESLRQAHRLMAAIPQSAADDEVLTQQLSVQRYATALLVRLRRLMKRGEVDQEADDLAEEEDENDV